MAVHCAPAGDDEGRRPRRRRRYARRCEDLERLAALRQHARRPVRRSGRFGRGGGGPVRRRPRPPAPRRRPAGAADAARRGAAQRLPADADDRGAQRRPVAPEPRLGLPDAGPARGRGPDPRRSSATAPSCSRSPTPAASSSSESQDEPAPWERTTTRTARTTCTEMASLIIQIGKAAWQVAQEGDERQTEQAARRWPRPAGRCTGSSPRTATDARPRTRTS